MTKHRVVINFSRLYAMKTSSGHEKKKYGIVLKAIAIECSSKTAPKYEPCVDLFDNRKCIPFTRYMIKAVETY